MVGDRQSGKNQALRGGLADTHLLTPMELLESDSEPEKCQLRAGLGRTVRKKLGASRRLG